jgi:hypothetical protein
MRKSAHGTLLTITGFSARYAIPRETVNSWIRSGRLNAKNGLVIVRGRPFVDFRLFRASFS